MHTGAQHSCRGKNIWMDLDLCGFPSAEMYVAPMKSFVFADVTSFLFNMGENLINLVSQHLVLHDKHNKEYFKNQLKDNIWLEITKKLGYNDDGNVVDVHLETLCVVYRKELTLVTTANMKSEVYMGSY